MWKTLSITWETCLQASDHVAEPSAQHEKLLQQLEPELDHVVFVQLTSLIFGLDMTKREALIDPIRTLQRWRYRESHDPRDKVYGLMGLFQSSDLPSITCDYTASAATVFTDLTLDLLRLRNNLLPLVGWRGEIHVTPGLPTWALDMVRPSNETETGWCGFQDHVPRFQTFKADDKMPMTLQVSSDKSILTLSGLPIDTIIVIDPGMTLGNDIREFVLPEHAIPIVKRREQLLSTFMSTEKPTEEYIGGGTWRDAFWRTMLGDIIRGRGPAFDTKKTLMPSDRRNFDAFMEHGTWDDAVCLSLMPMLKNQSFFITQKGYMGIGPRNLQVGDEAWILLGGPLPFILRPIIEDKKDAELAVGDYTFVGDAHVQGVMFGDFVRAGQENIRSVSLR